MTSDPIKDLVEALVASDQTLALAESCTGGLMSAEITEWPGVSSIFLGSVVCYSYAAKESLLGVSSERLLKYGAVSETIAKEMVLGAQSRFESRWAGAITGVAGPGGGTPQKPVGTVCFAWAGPGFVHTTTELFEGTRSEIRRQSTLFLARMLLSEIKSSSQPT